MRVCPPTLTKPLSALPIACLVSLASLGIGGPAAQALSFNFNFSAGTPQSMVDGFTAAGDLWSQLLVDDITLDIDVLFADLGANSLGSYDPTRSRVTYSSFLTQLQQDFTSQEDIVAMSSLPNAPDFDLLINGTSNNPNGAGSFTPYVDSNGGLNNQTVWLTNANAKALGYTVGGSDGTITLNSAVNWDFDVSDGINANAYDFVGVAAQGIGAVLGAVSGVETLEFNSPLGSTFFADDQFTFVTPTDLFRFSTESASQGVIDWTTGRTDGSGQQVDKYFSIDGGTTKIASFSTGTRHGDGREARAWKADELTGTYLGLNEPTVLAGQVLQFSENDQVLYDVIGWNLDNPLGDPPQRNIVVDPPTEPPTDVPEPSTIGGILAAVFGWRRLSKRRQNRSANL